MKHLLAQINNPVIDPKVGSVINTGLGGGYASPGLNLYLKNFVILSFIAGAIIFFVMLIMGSIEYITAGGEKEKVGNALKRIQNALVGIVLLFSVFAISRLIKLVFGIDVLNFQLPGIGPICC